MQTNSDQPVTPTEANNSRTASDEAVVCKELLGCGEWPTMPLMKCLGGDVNHEWHVAINKHASEKAGTDEWPHWMYEAKDAAGEVPRLALLFSHERNGKLCKTFRRCSCCSEGKHVVDNHLTCCLGVECRKCPHLAALEKANLPPEQRDWIKAWTCVGHILANGGDRANEGFITTVDDRMYWDGVYESLASTGPEQPNNGDYHIEHQLHGMDLIRKIHPLEQEPVAKASEEQKAPEIKNTSEAPAFRIDTPGGYRTRDGRLVAIEGVGNNAVGIFVANPLYHHFWNLDGRTTSGLEASSDIIQKIKSKHPEPPVIASREKTVTEVAKAPEIKKEPKKPTVAITQTGQYRTRDGRFVDITHIGQETAIGVFYNQDAEPFAWLRDGRFNEHCESDEDIVEKIEMSAYEGASDKWTKEEMDLLGAAAVEPKKRSAGFDLVIIRLNEQKCMLVVGDYENDDGDVKVRPIDYLDPAYVQRKCPDAIILQGDSYMVCPDTNVTCVIHYGGEE